jgi:hypothetical protein
MMPAREDIAAQESPWTKAIRGPFFSSQSSGNGAMSFIAAHWLPTIEIIGIIAVVPIGVAGCALVRFLRELFHKPQGS